MATLSEFSANIRARNLSRPYLYYVNILRPPILDGSNVGSELASMFCANAQTPSVNLMTDDQYNVDGIRRDIPYDYHYQNLTLEFMVDTNYEVREFFDKWIDGIIIGRRNFNYPDDYTAEYLELNILGIGGKGEVHDKVYKYTFNRIFPKSVNLINLSDAATNTVSTFTVDFVFETFKYERLSSMSEIDSPQLKSVVTNKEVLQSLLIKPTSLFI